MPKNRDVSVIFAKNKVSLLLDTSSIVRIRNFSDAIPTYATCFELYTLEKNKTELTFLTDNPSKSNFMMSYSLELIRQIQQGNIKTLKNGAPNVAMPKRFERTIEKDFPNNNLSYTDKLLIYFANSAPNNVALVTNDRELREIATKMGIVTFGAFELFLLMDKVTSCPTSVNEITEYIAESNQIINAMPHSS